MGGNQTAPGIGGNTGFALCGGRKTGRDTSYSKMRAGITNRGLLRYLPAGLVSAAVTLTTALLLLAAVTVPAWSADASDLKNTIEGWVHGGSGGLSAVVSDNTVTVTGEVTGASSPLSLDIDSGVTVVWKATLSSAAEKAISVGGAGTLEIAEGGVVRNDTGTAIYVEDTASEVKVTVSGGTVSATGDGGFAAILTLGSVTVSGGTVRATGDCGFAAIYTEGNVIVSGNGIVQATAGGWTIETKGCMAIETKGCVEIKDNATVSATTGRAINAGGSVTVNGGTVSATGEGDYAIYTEGNVIVSGGTVSVTGSNRYAIGVTSTTSTVEVSDGSVSATGSGSCAILTLGSVTVSGGTVSGGTVGATEGIAIRGYTNTTVTISGGVVYAFKNKIINYNYYSGSDAVVCAKTDPNVTGTGMIIACGPGSGSYTVRSATGIAFLPEGATAYWDRKEGKSGISYANGETPASYRLKV